MMNRCAELIVERAGSRHPNNFLTASSRSLIQPQRRGFKGVKILMPSQSQLSELLGSAATDLVGPQGPTGPTGPVELIDTSK